MLTGTDLDYIRLACSLNTSPGKNWVEEAGGLPEPICEMAKDIMGEGGKEKSHAIAIAVSQAKKLAVTSKDPKVKAKYTKAVAQWEALKAKSHAKSSAKKVAATLVLCGPEFNVDLVRRAFDLQYREALKSQPGNDLDRAPYPWIREMWNTYLIVEGNGKGKEPSLFKVPYSVDDKGEVTFGSPEPVTVQYVPEGEAESETMSDQDWQGMAGLARSEMSQSGSAEQSPTERLAAYHESNLRHRPFSGLDKILELSVLTTEKRKKLDKSDFAIPETESYPIHDEAHARNALSRVAQHGTPEEKKRVRAAVKKRYPNIGVGGDDDG